MILDLHNRSLSFFCNQICSKGHFTYPLRLGTCILKTFVNSFTSSFKRWFIIMYTKQSICHLKQIHRNKNKSAKNHQFILNTLHENLKKKTSFSISSNLQSLQIKSILHKSGNLLKWITTPFWSSLLCAKKTPRVHVTGNLHLSILDIF